MILRRFLTIALGLAALSPSAHAQDDAVLGAYAAFRAGDPDKLARHASALQGHTLEPWADYWRLRLRIDDAKPDDVQRFLARHAGTYLADLLRSDWLRELGRRGEWLAFERALGPLAQDDLEIRCYGWSARLARADGEAAVEARAAWLEPRELPDGCVTLTERLLRNGALGEQAVWQRVRLLLANGQVSAARRTLGYLPAKEQPDERLLTQAAVAPQKLVAQPPKNLEPRGTREVMLFAVSRLARNDARAAAAALEGALGANLPAEDRDLLWARIAAWAAQDHLPEALEWYARAGSAPLTDEQLAWKARAALRAGQWQAVREAIEPMSMLARQDPAWTYWYGRALAAQGDAERAQAYYQRIAGRPYYYGILATEELGARASVPLPFHAATEDEVDAARRHPELARALELFRLGLRPEATKEWMFAVRGMGDRELLAAAELARRAAVYDRAIGTAIRTEQLHDYRMRYLAPFREVFSTYAGAYDLEEAWVLGVVRQESRFIVDARSGAGAAGLMQLLPHTARWVAQKTGYRGYNAKRVADVETNIALGTRYLKFALDGTGHPVLASAAYNAGPNRARRWMPARPMEAAVFVETIPFNETRDYVKSVMANAVHYALLLEGRSTSLKQRMGSIPGRQNGDEPLLGELP
ncbi:MAG TPA: transglycosylase SLT domain-containing protein [Burkholderiales bacterium]|jgi:soluble lytic murein transglycosylase|nr:transglycosylase SLT domain-containing protein [Burkholderiales bacterium]